MVSQRSQLMVNVRATRSTSWFSSTSSRWAGRDDPELQPVRVAEDRGRHGVQHVDVEALDLARTAGCASPSAACRPRRRRAARRGRGSRPRSAWPRRVPGRRTSSTRCASSHTVAAGRATEAAARSLLAPAGAGGGGARAAGEQGDRRRGSLRDPGGSDVSWSPVLLHSLRDAAPGQDRRQHAGDEHQPADQDRRPAGAGQGVVRLRGAGLQAAGRGGRERREQVVGGAGLLADRQGDGAVPVAAVVERADLLVRRRPSRSSSDDERRRRRSAGPAGRAPRRSWPRTAPRTPPRSRA